MGERLLVIGGSGLLGGAVCRAANAAGHEITGTYATDHGRERSSPSEHGAMVRLDLHDRIQAKRLVELSGAAAVVNCAYVGSGDSLKAVTTEAPSVLASVCARRGIRFVQLSTDVVFDGAKPEGETYGELDVPNPVHAYGRAKLRAEELVTARDPRAVIVRTSLLYPGPHTQAVVDAIAGTTSTTFYTDELRNPCRADDLARFLVWLVADPEGSGVAGVVHAAGADVVSRFEFARMVATQEGFDPDRVAGAPSPVGGPPRARNCALRTDRGLPGLPLRGVREALGPPVS